MHPMGLPRRSLKFEMSFRARVTTGRWPLIAANSATAASRSLAFARLPRCKRDGHVFQPRDLEPVTICEVRHHGGHRRLLVFLFEPDHRLISLPAPDARPSTSLRYACPEPVEGRHPRTLPKPWPQRRQMRAFCPSARILYPTRTGALHGSHMIMTLETWIEASFSTMPPGCCALRGLAWRLTRFTRSMTTRLFFGST